MNEPRIDWDAQPLGKVSDRSLAQQLGVSRKLVAKQREKRCIAPHSAPRPRKGIDWSVVPLGTKPDRLIARELGVTKNAVIVQRQRRGIELTAEVREWSERLRQHSLRRAYRGRQSASTDPFLDPPEGEL